MGELLLLQLLCKHNSKVCEDVKDGKALFMVAEGQWWGRGFKCSREGMSCTGHHIAVTGQSHHGMWEDQHVFISFLGVVFM